MTIVTLEDLQTRSRFIGELATSGCAYVVEGPSGIARVLSPRRPGHDVELMWTCRDEAARWADVLVEQPRITVLPLDILLSRHLPSLAAVQRMIGVNWSSAPPEPEIGATELDTQVRRLLVDNFIETVTKTRQVWVLKQGDEPLTFITRHPAGGEVLPVFADRAHAERAIDGSWSGAAATRIPFADFVQKAVFWCVEGRRRIAPAYRPGPGQVELHPWEMKAILSGHAPVRRVA